MRPYVGPTCGSFRSRARSNRAYLRKLLVVGATSVIRRAKNNNARTGDWLRSLLERKPARVATAALANKTARIAWTMLNRGETYRLAAAV